MISTLKLTALLVVLLVQANIYAQSASQKRILVYFKTGVEKSGPANQNVISISSPTITQALNNYGIGASHIALSFPDFKEADTVNAQKGEETRQMNRAKVFSITLPGAFLKQ